MNSKLVSREVSKARSTNICSRGTFVEAILDARFKESNEEEQEVKSAQQGKLKSWLHKSPLLDSLLLRAGAMCVLSKRKSSRIGWKMATAAFQFPMKIKRGQDYVQVVGQLINTQWKAERDDFVVGPLRINSDDKLARGRLENKIQKFAQHQKFPACTSEVYWNKINNTHMLSFSTHTLFQTAAGLSISFFLPYRFSRLSLSLLSAHAENTPLILHFTVWRRFHLTPSR